MIVEDCVPTLPPIPMITGINAARAMAFSSKPSKTPMINAAKIPPTQLANSHGNLTLAFSQDDFSSISLSFPAPASCKKSSVASSLMTSTILSTVIMPSRCSSESTTGTARKLY